MRETRRRTLADLLTPAAVDAANRVQDLPTFRDAFAMLPSLAARHGENAGDIVTLAGVLLGELLDGTDREPSDAARLAVSRAVSWVGLLTERTDVEAAPIGDTFTEDLPHLYRTRVPAPDGIARWTTRDTVGSVLDAVGPASAEILTIGAQDWAQDSRARNGVSAVMLARGAGAGNVTRGRASQVWADCYASALAEVRSLTVPASYLPDALDRTESGERMRWEDVLTGPASPVVRTAPLCGPLRRGEPRRRLSWVTVNGETFTASTPDALAPFLGMLTEHGGKPGTVTEVTRADVTASTVPAHRSAPAVPGVTAGMRAGHAIAGMGKPYRKAQSSKRKRDGGIGGPMTRA